MLDAVYTERIAELKQKNIGLKARMESHEKSQTEWQAFKSEFNHNMGELGKALSDLAVNNKNNPIRQMSAKGGPDNPSFSSFSMIRTEKIQCKPAK